MGHGPTERLEVRLSGELRVEWPETASGAQKEGASIAAALLRERDLCLQELGPRKSGLVKAVRLDI
jgi:hypothetical protein